MKLSDIEVSLIDFMGSDLSIVNAARVSFHKESEWDEELVYGGEDEHGSYYEKVLSEKDRKLINYLAKHKHFSPFNHTFITCRVKAPIFVARQLVKHKFMPWNEVSRRYVDEEPEFYIPDIRVRSENAKQGSGHIHPDEDNLSIDIKAFSRKCLKQYNWLLAENVAPEIARAILPQNMHTEWIWSGTLGAYCDMLRLRLDPHTQYESRIVAQKIRDIIEPIFPVSVSALLATT